MSVMAAVGRTFIYASIRLKKYSNRPNRSISASLLARTSLMAYEVYRSPRHSRRNKEDAHIKEDSNANKHRICRREYLWSHTSEGRSRVAKPLATYRSNAVAEGRRECEQDIHSGIQPLCPLFASTLRLIEGLYLGSKNGENGSGRVAGLQLVGKGMGGNILLRLLFVRFPSSGKYCFKACGRCGSVRNLRHRVIEGAC